MALPLTLRAPAKLNLHLRVFPKAADGFHPLRSWFRTIDLFDDLALTPEPLAPAARPLQRPGSDVNGHDAPLRLTCSDPSLATDETNLVRKAWNRAAAPLPAAAAALTKRIPAGGGLGGGSSDAAAMLVLSGRFRDDRADGPALAAAAADLGSDVPFFLSHQLHGTADATCTGRGEFVKPFAAARRHAALVLLTDIPCPTPAVYRRFDELPAPPDDGEPDFAGWSALPAAELLPLLRNDLEPAAFSLRPDLAAVRGEAERRLDRPVRMTGSGGTLFTLFDDAAEAGRAAGSLRGWDAVRAVVA